MSLKQFPDDSSCIGHENEIMEKWKKENTYQKIIEQNKNKKCLKAVDGPPFVSSETLHMGHCLVGWLKNAVHRYNTMKGYSFQNKLGFDVHGIPIEQKANGLLDIKSHDDVKKYGIKNYNDFCKNLVKKYANSWDPIYDRIGRQFDPQNTYRTMDFPYMESVWWAFKQLWDKGLVYRGFEVMPYSVACGTVLSNFEASDSYKVIETESVYVKFALIEDPSTFLVAWTTTPWTLPANVALCVHPEARYVRLTDKNGFSYIVAEDLVDDSRIKYSSKSFYAIGRDLAGLEYTPPFNYIQRNKYVVVCDNFVQTTPKNKKTETITNEDGSTTVIDTHIGTGIVHIAPAFGKDDLQVCLDHKILDKTNVDTVCPVDQDGKYTTLVHDLVGQNVLEADHVILQKLQERNLSLRIFKYKHNYPHCYRSGQPLIYKAEPCFFIRVTAIRDKMLANNEKATFVPTYIGEKRFKNWLENAKDWCVSRSRYFGTPINVWVSEDGSEMECLGSVEELVKRAREVAENGLADDYQLTDLHLDAVGHLVIRSHKTGQIMRLTQLVQDCWFESGCVPFAQYHYPFENREEIDNYEYLADFIAEGLDQTRGWFYTLLVLSTAIFDKPAFKNVICTGLILDENGKKLSKKDGNFKNPMELLEKYGADTLRLYLLSSPCVRAEPLCFNEKYVEELRHRLIPLVNVVKFFTDHCINYTKQGHVFDCDDYKNSTNLTDQWIISRISSLISYVEGKMDSYQIDGAVIECIDFIDDLTNWYVKFNRDRLKGNVNQTEWGLSLSTLFTTLITYCKTTAPFMPFLSEHIYEYLKVLLPNSEQKESIHLCEYPKSNDFTKNEKIERKFKNLKQVVKAIRKLRATSKNFKSLKIPIRTITIIHPDETFVNEVKELEDLIIDEVNCQNFEYKKPQDCLKYNITFNNKSLGTKYRKVSNEIKNALLKVSNETLSQFSNYEIDLVNIEINDTKYELTREDFTVVPELLNKDKNSVSDGLLTIAIDDVYDQESFDMAQIRKFINYVQQTRKEMNLKPWDRINVSVNATDKVQDIISKYKLRFYERLGCEIKSIDDQNDNHNYKTFDWDIDPENKIPILVDIVLVNS